MAGETFTPEQEARIIELIRQALASDSASNLADPDVNRQAKSIAGATLARFRWRKT